jgi:hypothetical protein
MIFLAQQLYQVCPNGDDWFEGEYASLCCIGDALSAFLSFVGKTKWIECRGVRRAAIGFISDTEDCFFGVQCFEVTFSNALLLQYRVINIFALESGELIDEDMLETLFSRISTKIRASGALAFVIVDLYLPRIWRTSDTARVVAVWRAALCNSSWPSNIQLPLVLFPSDSVRDKKIVQRALQSWSSVLQAFVIWSQSNSGAAADVLHRLAQQTAYLCKSIDIWSINKHRQVNLHSNYAARLDLIALPFLYANRYCVKHVVVGLGHHAVSEDDCGRLRRAVSFACVWSRYQRKRQTWRISKL